MSARLAAILLCVAGCSPTVVVGRRDRDAAPDVPTCATPLVASQVALGSEHACALTDGVVRCWGEGLSGQLCAGNVVAHRALPSATFATGTFVEVEAGGLLTCMRRDDGVVLCCGQNFSGGLADGTSQSTGDPVQTVSGALDVEIGFENVYTRRAGDLLTVWGDDQYGQLGLGPAAVGTAVRTETDVAGSSFPVVHAATHHACALDDAGHLYCTGSNSAGELAMPGPARDVFTLADASRSYARLGVGYQNSCAVTTGGELYCWGANDPAIVPDRPPVVTTPVRVGDGVDFVDVDMGFDHGCVLRTGGRLACFGENAEGQLGYVGPGSPTLVEVTPGVAYSSVVAGRGLTCAIRASDSVVVCFGDVRGDRLGRGPTDDPSPGPVCLVR